uniref:PDZK1-interacting protein 1 n=1 Tax=Cairina moschata TaxID=8855 RepID=A0A8C3CLP8_CAIMO
ARSHLLEPLCLLFWANSRLGKLQPWSQGVIAVVVFLVLVAIVFVVNRFCLEAPAAGLGAAGGGRSMNLTSVRKGRQLGALPALHCRLGSSYGLEMLPAPWEGLGNRPWAGTGGGSKG